MIIMPLGGNKRKIKIEKKNFFLISFLPAILYWYLEENYPVKIAVIGGLPAALEICVESMVKACA